MIVKRIDTSEREQTANRHGVRVPAAAARARFHELRNTTLRLIAGDELRECISPASRERYGWFFPGWIAGPAHARSARRLARKAPRTVRRNRTTGRPVIVRGY
ncbi:hypothetical protein [Micromonospora sp. NPDC049645]|uniref:hypothetical protein n=1 Tax=Micromonospora sp. NPDC049645 TaxID=3155508 RepID=UPI00343E5AAD